MAGLDPAIVRGAVAKEDATVELWRDEKRGLPSKKMPRSSGGVTRLWWFSPLVMAGLDPAIVRGGGGKEDATVKPWHDEFVVVSPLPRSCLARWPRGR
jgi:hypothetical protein